jgi:hypothetical protein
MRKAVAGEIVNSAAEEGEGGSLEMEPPLPQPEVNVVANKRVLSEARIAFDGRKIGASK